MDSVPRKTPRGRFRYVLLFLLFLGLLASRRSEQWISPQVWGEDGQIFSGFVSHGWHSFLEPVNGYLVCVPKVVSAVAMAVSVYYYPLLGTAVAGLFIASVGVATATAPTRLKGATLCAVSIFLIPTNPETFGVPLYTFWWATLLLLLIALWDEKQSLLALRLPFVLAGGLSSPFILVVLPVLYFRALCYRKLAGEWIVASLATCAGVIQYHFMSTGAAAALPSLASMATYVIPKFCGWFLCGNLSSSPLLLWACGALVLVLVAGYCFLGRRDPTAWILAYLWCGAIASSISRIDPSILHPSLAGPRYFFLPNILLFWILIQFAFKVNSVGLRIAAAACCVAGALNAGPVWTRRHDDLSWAEHVRSARLFARYEVPIESDGNRFRTWSIKEDGSTWSELLRHDMLFTHLDKAALPTFAYRVVNETEGKGAKGMAAEGKDSPSSGEPSQSLIMPERDGKELLLSFRADGRVRYRSVSAGGAPSMEVLGHEQEFIQELPITKDWVTLEFSNLTLPTQFSVRIKDAGHGLGEWEPVGAAD